MLVLRQLLDLGDRLLPQAELRGSKKRVISVVESRWHTPKKAVCRRSTVASVAAPRPATSSTPPS